MVAACENGRSEISMARALMENPNASITDV